MLTRLPTQLIQRHPIGAVQIWLYCRSLDEDGRGVCQWEINAAAKLFRRSHRTIARWLTQAVNSGLLRYARTNQGIATTYYSALEVVTQRVGLPTLGAIAEIEVSQLPNARFIATEAQVQALQSASFHAAKLAQQKLGNKKPRMTPIENIAFQSQATPFGNGSRVLGACDRFLYVSEGFICYGGSQASTAALLGVCERTVQRHLCDRYRQARGLEPVPKRQLAHRRPRGVTLVDLQRSLKYCDRPQQQAMRYVEYKGRVYRLKTNLYEPTQTLIPCRYQRKRYKHSLSISQKPRSVEGD